MTTGERECENYFLFCIDEQDRILLDKECQISAFLKGIQS